MREERAALRAHRACLLGFVITGLTVGAGSSAAHADIVQSNVSGWNTLIETVEGNLSNGGDNAFFAGSTVSQGLRRGLLRFDVASMVPAGSTVTAVSLQLYMSRTISGPELVTMHRTLADWGQGTAVGGMGGGGGATAGIGDATWLHTFHATDFWTTAGGDFDATVSAAKLVGSNGYYTFAGAGLVADVQAWLDNPGTNFGWLFKGNEEVLGTAKRFSSGNHSNTAYRPLLVIEYTPVPGAPTACVLALGALTLTRRRRA